MPVRRIMAPWSQKSALRVHFGGSEATIPSCGEWKWLARLVALVVGALMSLFEKWPDVSMAGVGGVVSTSLAGSGRRLKRTQGNREHVEFGANLMGTAPSKIFTECREVCFS